MSKNKQNIKLDAKTKSNKKVTLDKENDNFLKTPTDKYQSEKSDNDEKEHDETDTIDIESDDDKLSDNENEIDNEDKELSIGDNENEEDDDNKEDDEVKSEHGDKCIYNYANKTVDDDNSEEDEQVFDDDPVDCVEVLVPENKRKTKPFLTKYERVRLLGDRTQQLTLGAKPMIKNTENLTPKQIAEIELEKNVIPLIIERPLPNGKKERWYVKELLH